ncbi:hypothetical protein CAPTEDRAFT_162949 [Capitella teleta]|uniref:Choline/carnitine acyltransferase domain-containing protein n=1 Tax=Capitella teleta TaxID=283909 RepID=R7UZB7_CAPTE|nr:hypothetical protein CAPTEDRAFT_162949 [Capitella teleta]|eukprot:ELU11602.1 hypothetical protein CAPTEDRAFT_162949 [Capitella teleta]
MLQKYVQEHPETSFVADYWNDMYLKQRDPLMFNSSVGTWDKEILAPELRDASLQATNLIVASLEFMLALQSETLQPYHCTPPFAGKLRKRTMVIVPHRLFPKKSNENQSDLSPIIPFCMSQFKHMFQGTRIPHKERDSLAIYPDAKHIVVMKNGRFFSFDVIEENGELFYNFHIQILSKILHNLRVIQKKDCPYPEFPVPVLTADNRDFWTDARKELIDNGNTEAVHRIDSAIMLIVLDDSYPDATSLLRGSLHGNGANRWFDKPYNFVTTEDGQNFSLMEHAWGDGIAGVYMKGWTKDKILHRPAVGPDTPSDESGTPIQEINFKLNDGLKTMITASKERFDEMVASLDLTVFHYDRYGSDFIKSKKISPDALSQTAFQLAYRRLFSSYASTYESCTTAIFKHGRTETMRPVTPQSTEFCDALLSGNSHKSHLLNLLRQSSSLHTRMVAEASVGQGCDRHLFALLKLSQSIGGNLPSIFLDPTFAHCMTFRVSSSTMGSHAVNTLAAFAPVTPDGYGIFYLMAKDAFSACISSYRQHKSLDPLTEELKQAFDDLHKVIRV